MNIKDLHQIKIMSAIQCFFIHLCYTEKLTDFYEIAIQFLTTFNHNLMGWSYGQRHTDRQTNKQTNKQTNRSENITSLAEVTMLEL